MTIFLVLFLTSLVHADAPYYWSHLTEIRDRHEFYADNVVIVKPKDSWQTLFSVVYTDIELQQMKDCVFYRVPGVEAGMLKIRTISASDSCDKHILQPGDKEWGDVRSLQFSSSSDKLLLSMSFPDYRSEKWNVLVQNQFKKPIPKMLSSSVDAKSSRIILLAPKKDLTRKIEATSLKNGQICHNINEDCEEVRPSTCHQCSEGWYEVPNGCLRGPKYCGRQACGKKNQPACRRGMVWQKKDEAFECRMDSSFAYCAKGLQVHCAGKLAYCR